MPNIKTRTTAVALAVGLSLGGAAYATAASQSNSSAPPGNPNEQALTGDTAEKVKAAALAKLPGSTVLRVETNEGGVYEAHVRQSDGTEAEVHVGKDFAVTSVDTRPAGGPGGRGHGGPGGRPFDTAVLAKSLGVTEAKLQAALDKVRPAKGDRDDKRTAAPRDKGDRGAEMAAALAKELGVDAAKVTSALEAQRPDRP
jgi:Clp amino terminal domain, pathogenicity island component